MTCGTCALWTPHIDEAPGLGGRCNWKSTEVWPASVQDVPGVRGPIALFMDYSSGKGCRCYVPTPASVADAHK